MDLEENGKEGVREEEMNCNETEIEAKDQVEEGEPEPSSEERLAELCREQEEQKERYLRLQADFDNFRKRSRQEKEDWAKFANADLLTSLLPVLDNFERALQMQAGDADKSFSEGVEMIYRIFFAALQQAGLEAAPGLGQDFDPQWHEAIGQEEVCEAEKGKIVLEVQKGYLLKGRLLRPAMVKVGS
ncbi:MAG: nucleotide exchange factor GrpE [Clostridiales bacterium]|jgi:molecular chaperone GrpE|nr:nucleotide exchange factor GrpE [Clostridiales bacterium]MDR2713841.1 nucleotide exchange factor GrpE [Clostridiales bacterium]